MSNRRLPIRAFSLSSMTLSAGLWVTVATADPIPARHVQGTLHGFLELRSGGDLVIASGDSTQVVRGNQVTSRTLFRFKDGSIDDEITVFSQGRTLRLISYHHIQKGPYFPQPTDMLVDARTGEVTVRSTGKDVKEEVERNHLDLPPDLANGLVPILIQDLPPHTGGTTVSMIVATPKPRLVKLDITLVGETTCTVVGNPRNADHYEIKIKLGGVVGVVAPLIGKAPPNIQIWAIGGDAPTFVREEGPLYNEGPSMTIQLASPVWPKSKESQ